MRVTNEKKNAQQSFPSNEVKAWFNFDRVSVNPFNSHGISTKASSLSGSRFPSGSLTQA